MSRAHLSAVIVASSLVWIAGCGGAEPPKTPGTTPPGAAGATATALGASGAAGSGAPASGSQPVIGAEAPVTAVPSDSPIAADPYKGQPPDVINKSEPLKPVFFAYDSDQLDDAARQALSDDAVLLKKYPGWVVTIEGHSDERGTAEYNLALGERRALATRTYLLSLGFGPDRFKVVSYGKEFPFDPGHSEQAWSKNRRAHLVVTASK